MMMAIFAHVVDIYTLTTPGLATFHLPQNLPTKVCSIIYILDLKKNILFVTLMSVQSSLVRPATGD